MKRNTNLRKPLIKAFACFLSLLMIFECSSMPGAAQEFRVTEAVLKADDPKMSGKCPIRVNFTGDITTNGAGTVKYTFTRSDGATAPVYALDFKAAGTQTVSTTWTLGDAAVLPFYEGWQAIKILSPNEFESSREAGRFSITCDKSGDSQTKKQLPDTNLQNQQLSFVVDTSLKPSVSQMLNGKNDEPRPVASIVGPGGAQTDFVENELIVTTTDPGVLQKIVERWSGKVLRTIDFKESQLGLPPSYLVRIDASSADTSKIAWDFQALAKKSGWMSSNFYQLRVSSEAGLKLLAAAANSAVSGFQVSYNVLFYPRDIASRRTVEAASSLTGWDSNAFSWSYINRGSAQNTGVGEAWRQLDRAFTQRGRPFSRVKIGILDSGFTAPDADTPTGAVVMGSSGGGFHGARVTDALMAIPDNNFGTAGPAGLRDSTGASIADPVLVESNLDMFDLISGLARIAATNPKIINLSFGATIDAVPALIPGELINMTTRTLRARGILIFAAAPNSGSFDVDALEFGGLWESQWDMPCENDDVICVGGMGDNTRVRDSGSAFGSRFGTQPTSIDIFAPFNIWVAENPGTMPSRASGNSMAAPFVAGIAAMIWTANPALSANQVERILLETGQRGTAPTDVPLRPDALTAVCRALPGGCPSEPLGEAISARFRVTINGFKTNRPTIDKFLDEDGAKDEVFLRTDASLFDRSTNRIQPMRQSLVIGDSNTRPERIRAGRARSFGGGNGGFEEGDTFPAGTTPWLRVSPPTVDRPPLLAWEGQLTRDTDALSLIPSFWESDINSSVLDTEWTSSVGNTFAGINSEMHLAISRRSGHEPTPEMQAALRRFFDSVRVPGGGDNDRDRPIGMENRGNHYGYTPQMLVLTYDAADRIARTDFGFGAGIIPLSFKDRDEMRGDYTVFVQIERLNQTPNNCAADMRTNFSGEVVMTTSHPRVREPIRRSLSLGVEVINCRTIVSILQFPAITSDPIEVSPGVRNTTTVTLISGGSGNFDSSSGSLAIPIRLRFAHSHPFAGTDVIDVTLSTENPGASRYSMGRATLTGSGTFRGGFLNGQTGNFVVVGSFTPAL